MATFNGCDRILKADVCLVKLYLKTMYNQLSNYSVTSIKICHIVCALNIFFFFKTPANFFQHIDLIFYIHNVCLPFYKLIQLTVSELFLWGAKLGILYKML